MKRLIERLGVPVLGGAFIFATVMQEYEETQRKNLGDDFKIYAMIQMSEEILAKMPVYDGKKDEDGECVGDTGGEETAAELH